MYIVYNQNMKQIHPKIKGKYRPLVGLPYKPALLLIARELNRTSLNNFSDLGALRHCVFEYWKIVFPGVPFPKDADALRTQYHRDPGTR